MMADDKIKVLVLLNILNPGTGPFQRAIRFNDKKMVTTILSCFDTSQEVRAKAALLSNNLGNKRLVGLGHRNKVVLVYKLCRYIYYSKADIVQTNHTFSSVVAIIFCFLFMKCKVVNFEGTLLRSMVKIKYFFVQSVIGFADASICVSNAVKNDNEFYDNSWRKRLNRKVIYNGVDHADIDKFHWPDFRTLNSIGQDKLVIGFVGDLKSVKDIPTLLRAFSMSKFAKSSAQLVIIGDGELKKDLIDLSISLEIRQYVTFTGMLERREVYGVLKEMSIFVLPSKVEGLSEALAQAMSSSLPVITSNIKPNTELVKDGYNGFVFPLGDEKSLSVLLDKLLDDKKLRVRLGANGKAVADDRLSIYDIVEQYYQFYKDTING